MMLMFMANRASRFKRTLQICFYCCFGITSCPNNNLNVPFIKNVNCTSSHTTTDDDVYSTIGKKIRQESRFMSGVSNCFTFNDFVVFGVKNHKPFAMSKVLSHHSVITCYSNSNHFNIPPFFLILLQPAQANRHQKVLSCPYHRRQKFWV